MYNKNLKPIQAKVTATFRCNADVKQELINRAQAAGLPPSQYYEMVLINGSKNQDEIMKLKSELEYARTNLSTSEARHNLENNSRMEEMETAQIQNQNSQSRLEEALHEIDRLKNAEQQQILGKVRDEGKPLVEEPIREESFGYATPHDIMLPLFQKFG